MARVPGRGRNGSSGAGLPGYFFILVKDTLRHRQWPEVRFRFPSNFPCETF